MAKKKTQKKQVKSKKQRYSCWHAHDYSVIEEDGCAYLEISNGDDDEEEQNATIQKIERIVDLLNKDNT